MFIPKDSHMNVIVNRFSKDEALALCNVVHSGHPDWTCQIFAGMGAKFSVEVYNRENVFLGHYI